MYVSVDTCKINNLVSGEARGGAKGGKGGQVPHLQKALPHFFLSKYLHND